MTTLPQGFTDKAAGSAGLVEPAEEGYHIRHAWDRCKSWKRAGAQYVKGEDGKWLIHVPDLTTLVRCALARGPLAVTPEVAKHLAQREKFIESSRATDASIEIPAPEGLKYMPFQRGGIAYALARKGVLFGDEMGLGKTIQVLGLVNAARGRIRSVCIVCPASLKLNWRREAGRWLVPLPDPSHAWRFWVADDRGDPCPSWATFAIVNYDRLTKHRELWAREWDLVAADEAHYAKNPKARRTRMLVGGPELPAREPVLNGDGTVKKPGRAAQPAQVGLLERGTRRALLTGTPLPNRPHELYTIAHALAPASFPNENQFKKRYCNGSTTGASNLDELQEKMRAAFMVRRLKSEVLTELPPKVRQVVPLPIDGAEETVRAELDEWKHQDEHLEELRAEVALAKASGDGETYKRAVAALREGERIAFVKIAKVRHQTAVVKVPYVLDHIRELFEGGLGKLLVFGHHRDVLGKLREGLKEHAPAYIDGDVSIVQRQAEVDRFQADPACRVAVLSITAAGVGLTMTAASTVLFAELDWVPGNITQAEDRAHRIGQKDSVHVIHAVFDGSLDARMAKTLVEKQELAEMALDRKVDPAKVTEMLQRAALPVPEDQRQAAAAPKKYAPTTPEARARLLEGLRILAAYCDGARQVDNAGFSKFHAKIGRDLAARADLSDGQAWLAAKICNHYHRQLAPDIVETARAILAAKSE